MFTESNAFNAWFSSSLSPQPSRRHHNRNNRPLVGALEALVVGRIGSGRMSSRMPGNAMNPLNMACVPPAMPAMPSPLMCSMPAIVPAMNIGGGGAVGGGVAGADQWSAVWTTPPNAYQFNYPLSHQSLSAAMAGQPVPYVMNGFANTWNTIPVMRPQMNAFMATNRADNHMFNHMNGIGSQTSVPSIHQRYATNCDNNNSTNNNNCTQTSQQMNARNKSFDVVDSHSSRHTVSAEPESKRKRRSDSKSTADESSKGVNNEDMKPRVRANETTDKKPTTPSSAPKKEPNPIIAETEQIFTKPIDWWRCSPADLFYEPQRDSSESMTATKRLIDLRDKFRYELLERSERALQHKPKFEPPVRTIRLKVPKTVPTSSDSSSCESDSNDDDCEDTAYEELQRKKRHPLRLHEELWYNDAGEMNDGPLCRCSAKARKTGIRHGIYPGEEHLPLCDPNGNNRHRLHHYRVAITPNTNFLTKFPTVIPHDGHDFVFEGYSLLSHWPLTNPIPCKVIRFNIEYTVTFVEEKFPTNFSVLDLEFFTRFVFNEILELVDLNFKAHMEGDDGCPRFHFLPRFSRLLDENGKELLSLNVVLQYLLNNNRLIIDENRLDEYKGMSGDEWQSFAKHLKGMIVSYPGMKPSSLRVDQIDRETDDLIDGKVAAGDLSDDQQTGENDGNSEKSSGDGFPVIVHFGIRPPQLSYAGNPKYQKAWRDYVKFRHLLANKKKVSYIDKQTLLQKEEKLQEMRMKSDLKRDVTQQRLLNFGTNPDHARNALTNCGIRQPQYGDRRVHFMNTRKRGINMLINIMSRFGCNEETTSNINHNERLEFLGDAVVEFMSSIHLYFIFPDLEEGGLATYRAALVQNQQLAVLAKKLQLEKFMLYAHGSDLCHDLELRHAMANCFEALMGALFLDGGVEVSDRIFSNTLFGDEPPLLDVWINYPKHPLQSQEPTGDRHYIETIPRLKELIKFEDITGIEFSHIRLLARAFTHRSVGFNNLTLGSNQRMEFLGDTVLQLVASEYLYKYFPEHHEGHLSLLRSSLVNNKTQAVVCDDLAMTSIAIYNYAKGELKTKDRADLLEAFLGALYVDKGLLFCRTFCEVCFFPRLEHFIMNQDWNDPKSKLQQCCLTLRSVDGGEPDIPVYKVIECRGPTNTRVYVVAVYFRDQRLATGTGHSIQEAEMNAASNALESSRELFPQLSHQKKVIERSVKSVKTQFKTSREKRREKYKKCDSNRNRDHKERDKKTLRHSLRALDK
ncbi:unnamed protein product [Medioppia subpectinata]|uniref:Ribonuclease 3 n=1 Tax=Medioppia subpectinata TaxID=1979941 RepID=A0A7R9KQJ7_9ACAR|nr:unnamed protein product [Medioppia subpectinata]CAG2107966.1 unnamed protein product [Medioppia subpectinata]